MSNDFNRIIYEMERESNNLLVDASSLQFPFQITKYSTFNRRERSIQKAKRPQIKRKVKKLLQMGHPLMIRMVLM